MFTAKTERIKELAGKYPRRIDELERVLDRPTNVYIDYANVRPWATKLGWHMDLKRLKQFLDSFDTIRAIKLYQGTLAGDPESEQFAREVAGTSGTSTIPPPPSGQEFFLVSRRVSKTIRGLEESQRK